MDLMITILESTGQVLAVQTAEKGSDREGNPLKPAALNGK